FRRPAQLAQRLSEVDVRQYEIRTQTHHLPVARARLVEPVLLKKEVAHILYCRRMMGIGVENGTIELLRFLEKAQLVILASLGQRFRDRHYPRLRFCPLFSPLHTQHFVLRTLYSVQFGTEK